MPPTGVPNGKGGITYPQYGGLCFEAQVRNVSPAHQLGRALRSDCCCALPRPHAAQISQLQVAVL